MAVQQTTDSLTDSQREKLVSLLEKVENATSGRDAVWLGEDDRKEIREIRKIIQNQ